MPGALKGQHMKTVASRDKVEGVRRHTTTVGSARKSWGSSISGGRSGLAYGRLETPCIVIVVEKGKRGGARGAEGFTYPRGEIVDPRGR